MRFLMTMGPCTTNAGKDADASKPFDEKLFTAMMNFNEEMTRAGVLIAAEGLLPNGLRTRVETNSAGKRAVVDGPYAETKEVLGGFYLIEVDSAEEAIGWAKRHPGGPGHDTIDIRQLTELSDLTPDAQKMIAKSAPLWSSRLWRSKDAHAAHGQVDPMPARASRS
jgi:hypothetical protein